MNFEGTTKAIKAFLEANNLSTKPTSKEGGLDHYVFNLNAETISKYLDVIMSVSNEGDLSISVYLDIDKEDVDEDELYRLINWLNLENSAFIGCATYIEQDHAIAVLKSIDSYFQKDIYGEDISYLIKLQVSLFEDYFKVIEDVINGETVEDAVKYYSGNSDIH